MKDKNKQDVLLLRRLLQKNAPELYKIWSARKMSQYATANAVEKTADKDIMKST